MRLWFCQGLLAVLILVGGRLAQADSDPAYQEKLEKEQVQIDAAVVQAGGTIAKKLSDMFHIKPDLIQSSPANYPALRIANLHDLDCSAS